MNGARSSSRGSRRGGGRGRGKVHSKRGKRIGLRHHSGGKYLMEMSEATTSEEVVEKTLGRLYNLAEQTFAFAPFSQYFDDWLLSLKSVVSEFEFNPTVELDEKFVKARSQIIADIELRLCERRSEEAVFKETTRKLADCKTLLVQTDTRYSFETQNLASERKSEIKRLRSKVKDLEKKLEEIDQTRVGVFSPLARRAKSHKQAELKCKLDAAKSELESEVEALEAEQKKLRIEYEKNKQTIMEQVRSIKKKVEGLETDGSAKDRQAACESLIKTIRGLLQRKKTL